MNKEKLRIIAWKRWVMILSLVWIFSWIGISVFTANACENSNECEKLQALVDNDTIKKEYTNKLLEYANWNGSITKWSAGNAHIRRYEWNGEQFIPQGIHFAIVDDKETFRQFYDKAKINGWYIYSFAANGEWKFIVSECKINF